MFSPEASTWKGRLRVPLLDQIHCFGFPDRAVDILPRMNAGDSRISRFGFLFDTTKQERRGR